MSDTSTVPSITGVSVDKGKSLTYKIKITGMTIRIGSSIGLNNSNLSLSSGTTSFDIFGLPVSEVLLVGLLNIYEYAMSYKNATVSTGYLNVGLNWWPLTPYDASNVSTC